MKWPMHIGTILIIGLVIRVAFILVGADFFFNRENIHVDGDTSAWIVMFENLLYRGTFTFDITNPDGYFARMPGYSFFMGIFYILSGKEWESAVKMIGWFQTLADVGVIYLVYQTARHIFHLEIVAVSAGYLYALYPFVIVWLPVAYSESVAILFLFLGLYFYSSGRKNRYLWAGLFLGISVLFRPQLLLILGLGLLLLFIKREQNRWKRPAVCFALGACVTYGLWPIRNYVNHGRLVLTQNINGFPTCGKDWMAFTNFMFAVQEGWQPQFDEIVQNKPFTIPAVMEGHADDSLLLVQAVYLAKNCASSFSYWKGYWKQKIPKEEGCDAEVAMLFDKLTAIQKEKNPFNIWVRVPLKNLRKVFFKNKLIDSTSLRGPVSAILFTLRSIILIAGIIGSILFLRKRESPELWLIILYFTGLILLLCFATGGQFRNIEMRYLLPAEVLILLPASFTIALLLEEYKKLKIRWKT